MAKPAARAALSPVVFCDALRLKIRDEATVRVTAVYLAVAVLPDGSRDILGIWIEQTEGAKFWMKVFTDLKARRVRAWRMGSPLSDDRRRLAPRLVAGRSVLRVSA